jgi:hypothetical protein
MINALDEYRKNLTASKGLEYAKSTAIELGGSVIDNPDGGTIIVIAGETVHVWQLFPDIDRIYYEY